MGAVGIHHMAVDNSWQYRPQESPANGRNTSGAVDAVGISLDVTPGDHTSNRAPDLLTSTMALQSRLERR
jgi:hypothetical protein